MPLEPTRKKRHTHRLETTHKRHFRLLSPVRVPVVSNQGMIAFIPLVSFVALLGTSFESGYDHDLPPPNGSQQPLSRWTTRWLSLPPVLLLSCIDIDDVPRTDLTDHQDPR
jgi:hypothetical protein